MRYSTETRFKKYGYGYVFLSFARKFRNRYGKKLIDIATKTGIDAAKIASKRVVQKTAETTGDLIGNEIADKITSIGKAKEKIKEIEEIHISPEKRNQIIDVLNAIPLNVIPLIIKCVHYCIKMEFQKIANFLDKTPDGKNFPKFVTKKWIEVHDQSGRNYNVNKEIRIKTSMPRSDLCDYSDAYIVGKGDITVDQKKHLLLMILKNLIIQQLMLLLLMLQMIMRLVEKSWFFKTMFHLSIAFQKLMD